METSTLTEPSGTPGLSAAVLDALDDQICVVDNDGIIVAVNRAWSDFVTETDSSSGGAASGLSLGLPYLQVCRKAGGPGASDVAAFEAGLRAVLDGERDLFEIEYPSDALGEAAWFVGRITPLSGDREGAVISHMNVTMRKRAEADLERLALTDELTGLPNRRCFDEEGERELSRIRRYGGVGALVMIDLDYFKQINDTYGHPAGDEALRAFARISDAFLRETDLVARFGGEEFAVILRDADAEQAAHVSEQLREAVERASIICDGTSFGFSASFGIAEIRPDEMGLHAVIDRADRALLAAKRTGRNRVRVA